MTHLSKMNMLTSLDACDPMPQLRWYADPVSDPRLEITQIQECMAGDARRQKYAEERHFETINYTPDLDKLTGKKLPGLPMAPKKKQPFGKAITTTLATAPTMEPSKILRGMMKSVQELMEEACGLPMPF